MTAGDRFLQSIYDDRSIFHLYLFEFFIMFNFVSKKRRRSRLDPTLEGRPCDTRGNRQEGLVREDDQNDLSDEEDQVDQREVYFEEFNEGDTDENEDGSSKSSTQSGNVSESSSDDQPKTVECNYLDNENIDVLRMIGLLWNANESRRKMKRDMQSIKISVSLPKTQYEVSKRFYDWKGCNKISDEGFYDLCQMLAWAGLRGLPLAKDLLQGIGCIPDRFGLRNIDSFLCFQQCPKSCMVYHGDHSTDLQCAICESPRFAACAKCSPRDCSCLMDKRTPLKTFYYSSLIFYLRDKLSQPTAANFVMALKTEVVKIKDTHINDISDGVSVKKAIKGMDSTFKAYCNKNKNSLPPQGLIMVNLVLGGYYDGAQLYTSKVESFWPAGITILNLPPSYRFKEGIGFHLWALFMGKTPSAAEDYLFGSCLGEELKLLKDGIIIAKKYFVQARFVISVVDSKAHQHFTRFQSVGSCSACPSCGFRGTYVGKVVYTDHRKYLGWNHAYRAIGQSLKCCPEHQYSTAPQNSKNLAERGKFWKDGIEHLHPGGTPGEQTEVQTTAHINRYKSKIVSTGGTKKDETERKHLAASVCNDEVRADIDMIYTDIMDDDSDFLFYHHQIKPGADRPTFSYTDFNAHMYFVNCYYKDFESGQRISEEELRVRMRETDELISETNTDREREGKQPLSKLTKPENGCHGSFALVDAPVSIQSFMIWDPFHVLPNAVNRLIDLLAGTTKFTKHTIELCKRVGMHESVGEKELQKEKKKKEKEIKMEDIEEGLEEETEEKAKKKKRNGKKGSKKTKGGKKRLNPPQELIIPGR